MKKYIAILALALVGGAVHGQTAITTNGAPAAGISKASPPINLEVSPEVQLQILEGARQEIGHVPPGDLEDLLARHSAEKAKWRAIAERKAAAKAAAEAANRQAHTGLTPSASTPPVQGLGPSSTLIVTERAPQPLLSSTLLVELDSAIAQLTTVRGKLASEEKKSVSK